MENMQYFYGILVKNKYMDKEVYDEHNKNEEMFLTNKWDLWHVANYEIYPIWLLLRNRFGTFIQLFVTHLFPQSTLLSNRREKVNFITFKCNCVSHSVP
jgi:hypothetical protein